MEESSGARQRTTFNRQPVVKKKPKPKRAKTVSEQLTGMTPEQLTERQAQLRAEFYARRLGLR